MMPVKWYILYNPFHLLSHKTKRKCTMCCKIKNGVNQDFFNTIKVFENKEDNQGIVIRGHMEIYVARSIKQKYRLVYVCYEGGW